MLRYKIVYKTKSRATEKRTLRLHFTNFVTQRIRETQLFREKILRMGQGGSKVLDQMGDVAGKWNSRDVKGTQSELFWRIVPDDESAFETAFKENQLDYVFTSDKLVLNPVGAPGKKYNLLHLWRDAVNGKTALPVLEVVDPVRGVYRVMMPLGAPGLHLGENHGSKGTHLIVIKASRDGVVTFNDLLPTTEAETNDFEFRMGLLDKAYDLLKRNAPLEDCGPMVVNKAKDIGVEPRVGIRQFLVTLIDHLPDKDGRPGFTLRDEENVDIAEDSTKVAKMIESVFTNQSLKVFKAIQPPSENSQLIAHIHGFLLTEMPECLKETYINCEEILAVKRKHLEMMVSEQGSEPQPEPQVDVSEEEDEDPGAVLQRTDTVART